MNLSKTKVVHYQPGSKTPLTDFTFKYGDKTVEICQSYKYLGLVLNEFLGYNITCKIIAQSANRTLGVLIAKSKAYGGMPYDCYTKLFNAIVQPILDYGAGIWGNRSYSCINAVQHRAE